MAETLKNDTETNHTPDQHDDMVQLALRSLEELRDEYDQMAEIQRTLSPHARRIAIIEACM